MAIIIGLMLLVPALIGLLCYEKFRGIEFGIKRRVEFYLIFAFFVNLAGYAILWLRGWDKIEWSLGNNSSALLTGVVTQYMLITLVAAVVLAYVLSLVRVGKSKASEQEDTADNPEGK